MNDSFGAGAVFHARMSTAEPGGVLPDGDRRFKRLPFLAGVITHAPSAQAPAVRSFTLGTFAEVFLHVVADPVDRNGEADVLGVVPDCEHDPNELALDVQERAP